VALQIENGFAYIIIFEGQGFLFMKWLELTLSYSCNCGCRMCFVPRNVRSLSMDDSEITENLLQGKKSGATRLWLSGGEPTIQKKLANIAKVATKTGYSTIKIQSNGMMFSYREFCEKCLEAGINEFNVSIKGHDAKSHDWMTQKQGAFDSVIKGIENLKDLGAYVEADILISSITLDHLKEMVSMFRDMGVDGFDFWYLCLAGIEDTRIRDLLPSLHEVGPALSAALEEGRRLKTVHMNNYHIPACFLPGLEKYCVPAFELGLLVCNPGGYRFMLEESPMEKGEFLDECRQCRWLTRCPGFRRDYLEVFGPKGLPPLASRDIEKSTDNHEV